MKSMGFRKKLIVAGLALSIAMAGTACSKQLVSDPYVTATSTAANQSDPDVDPLSFSVLDAKIREYNFGINEYMREHAAEATQKTVSGATLGGVPAECTYTISPDGKYESLQMMKTWDNGTQFDEYFNLGDAIFIARSTVYNDGNFEPVEKYYITNNVLYKIDGSAETVTKIIDLGDAGAEETKANLDIYFSFDEIRALYA